MNHQETMAASAALDRHLKRAAEDTMAELGPKKMVGELAGLFEDIRRTVDQAKQGITGAASELMEEVKGLQHVESAIRSETESVRQFKTQLLGNATGGENQGG